MHPVSLEHSNLGKARYQLSLVQINLVEALNLVREDLVLEVEVSRMEWHQVVQAHSDLLPTQLVLNLNLPQL